MSSGSDQQAMRHVFRSLFQFKAGDLSASNFNQGFAGCVLAMSAGDCRRGWARCSASRSSVTGRMTRSTSNIITCRPAINGPISDDQTMQQNIDHARRSADAQQLNQKEQQAAKASVEVVSVKNRMASEDGRITYDPSYCASNGRAEWPGRRCLSAGSAGCEGQITAQTISASRTRAHHLTRPSMRSMRDTWQAGHPQIG